MALIIIHTEHKINNQSPQKNVIGLCQIKFVDSVYFINRSQQKLMWDVSWFINKFDYKELN